MKIKTKLSLNTLIVFLLLLTSYLVVLSFKNRIMVDSLIEAMSGVDKSDLLNAAQNSKIVSGEFKNLIKEMMSRT